MRMNDSCKLNFALNHIAHLEDYINEDSNPSLIEPLNAIKFELERQENLLQSNLQWRTVPLFAKPLASTFIHERACNKLKELASKVKWFPSAPIEMCGSKIGEISDNRYILNDDEELKEYIKSCCLNGLKVLGYDTDIQITTSWFTLTKSNGMSNPHCHSNSWFSSVIYFDDYDEGSSPLNFSVLHNSISVEPTEHNSFTGRSYNVQPQTGMFLLFPSDTIHQVTYGENKKERLSLALNIMPKGIQGQGDSVFDY